MTDIDKIRKVVAMLSATSGEAANAVATLSKIAAAKNLTIGGLMERTYGAQPFQFDQQGLDDIAEQVRASHAEAERWRAIAEMWQARAQRAPETEAPIFTPLPPTLKSWLSVLAVFALLALFASTLRI